MVIATFMWGFMGVSSRYLNEIQMNSYDISFVRSSFGFVLTAIFLYFTNKSAYKVDMKGLIFCAFYGILNFAIGISASMTSTISWLRTRTKMQSLKTGAISSITLMPVSIFS